MYKILTQKPWRHQQIISNALLIIRLITIILITATLQVNAKTYGQKTIPVHGRVVDEKGNPLAGAIIKIKKGKASGATNNNGEFVIQCVNEDVIVGISFIGYVTKELSAKAILANPVIKLESDINKLNEVGIESNRVAGTKIDLKHRSHQTLAQVLEGGVPGLTLKRSTTTKSDELTMIYDEGLGVQTLRENYENLKRNPSLAGPDFLILYPDFDSYYKAVYNGLSMRGPGTTIRTKSTTDNGIIPELRGASSFTGGTSGMLIVIDGFVQDNFPANYPMNNVASIEIIRDPAECIKWGPKASGGVILITTNLAKPGELQIAYNTNLYFSPRPDVSASKLQLASSADLLGYYREAYDRGIATYVPDGPDSEMPRLLSPAEMLLFDQGRGRITKEVFDKKWDSLSAISNRSQLRMLQQSTFNQNHSLSVSGGTKKYLFNLSGLYGTNRSSVIGNKSRTLGLNLKNDLSLLNNNLKAKLVLDVTNSNNSSSFEDGSRLDPYQLLLNSAGGYLYNYNMVTPDQNKKMFDLGYYHSGVNLLEDARLNSNTSKLFRINSSLDLDWKLTKNLQWSTSLRYSKNRNNIENLQDGASSQARELINNYGQPNYDDPNHPMVDFYVPSGAIFRKTVSKGEEYNIRSGLVFNRVFNSDHLINVGIDGALSGLDNKGIPNVAIYGYNSTTGKGLPLQASVNPSIKNYLGTNMNLGPLSAPGLNTSSYIRSLTLNGNFLYSYKSRYSLITDYAAVLIPDFGGDPPYSTTSNRSISGIWQVNKENFFSIKWINSLKVIVNAAEMQVAKLPAANVSASQFIQPLWNNAAISVDGYNNTQQSGQTSRDLGGKIEVGFSEERIRLELGYNHNSIGKKAQWNARFGYDIGREPYFKVPLISSLLIDVALQNINPYQGLMSMIKASSISAGGGFSMPASSNLGLLPPEILNKEAHLMIGLAKDRFTLDMRYYHKTTAGLSSGVSPTDPATGLSSQVNYSKILNKGLEVSFRAGLVQGNAFSWTVTLNGAYNVNQAIDVAPVNFLPSYAYLTAPRNGYPLDNLWSFNWARLDALGNPQVYSNNMQKLSVAQVDKITSADSLSLIYSGRTRAPWSGAIIQEWRYNGFFASARVMFNLGHVMKRYMPVLSASADKNIQIDKRWRKAGDELFTDIAGIANDNFTRAALIQNSSNGILPADNLRLREIQLGYEVSPQVLKDKFIRSLTLSVQMENVALWTRNKMHIDPEVVRDNGAVGMPLPKNYILSINMSF